MVSCAVKRRDLLKVVTDPDCFRLLYDRISVIKEKEDEVLHLWIFHQVLTFLLENLNIISKKYYERKGRDKQI